MHHRQMEVPDRKKTKKIETNYPTHVEGTEHFEGKEKQKKRGKATEHEWRDAAHPRGESSAGKRKPC